MGSARLSRTRIGFTIALALVANPLPGLTQPNEVVTVETDSGEIRTGELFHLVLRTHPSAGWAMDSPDSIPGLRGLKQAGSVHRGTGAGGVGWAVSYPLVALRPGYRPLPSLDLRWRNLESDQAETAGFLVQIPLGGIQIRSVLPPPGGTVSPEGLLSTPPQRGRSPLLAIWTLVASGLMGLGWFLTRGTSPGETKETAPPWDLHGSEPPESLQGKLIQLLRRPLVSDSDHPGLVDDAIPLLRSLLEIRLSRSITGLTTPELLTLLATNGAGLEGPGLKRALWTANQVRFRPGMATPDETRGFRDDLLLWLHDTDSTSPEPERGGQDV